MIRFDRVVIQVAIIALLTYLLVEVAASVSPRIAGLYRETRLAILEAAGGQTVRPGHTGLIYVESPEVYTRQRLVNDRYLQDAWLRGRLREVDSPDAGWLDEAQVGMRRAVVSVLAGEGSVTRPKGEDGETPEVTLSDEALKQLSTIPFETRFRLQSDARDKIRQMILENALDDRHDLSGNTVFGLKFDTSILPASETLLHPTVIVRMDDNPLDILLSQPGQRYGGSPQETAATMGENAVPAMRREPEEFVRHFMRYVGDTGEAVAFPENELGILSQIDQYFENWLDNVERRLDEYRGQRETACELVWLETQLCTGANISDDARMHLAQLFNQVEDVDDALAYVTRLPESKTRVAAQLRDQVFRVAEAQCKNADTNPEPGKSIGNFLDMQQEFRGPFTVVPGAWGQFLDALTEFRLSRRQAECRLDVDIFFFQREIDVYVIKRDPRDEGEPQHGDVEPSISLTAGLVPLTCDAKHCPDFEVWVQPRRDMRPEAIERLKSALAPSTLASIEAAASIKYPRALCRMKPEFGDSFLAEGESEEELKTAYEEYGAKIHHCGSGRQVQLRLGAFEFFRRMSEVESYTYAAFPRGDVTGVVTEAGRTQSVQGGGGLTGLSGWASFGGAEASRTYRADPEVINFASGQSRFRRERDDQPKLFDFGWTVVKTGNKEAMMVSQLVLLSVPAYLDEIRLTLWKGFLSLDKVPADRNALAYPAKKGTDSEGTTTPAGRGDSKARGSSGESRDKMRSFNQLDLAERIDVLMDGYERRTITLKVPPDFAALDGIVIGHNQTLGPQINKKFFWSDDNEGNGTCLRPTLVESEEEARPYYLLDVVIPGDRLWRSTVVTLGGTKAQQIEVMPDMRGILARFHLPEDSYSPEDSSDRSELLWVWTSEGKDSVHVKLCRDRDDDEEGRVLQQQSSVGPENEPSPAAAVFGDMTSTSGRR
jgi:hypothetical protein